MAQVTARYNVTVVVGKYKTQDGAEKNRYHTIWQATEFDGEGMVLELYSIPPNRDYKASLFKAKDWQSRPKISDNGNVDDDLPF